MKKNNEVIQKFMNKCQLAKHFGMSKRGIEEALLQTIADGIKIKVIRTKTQKGYGHPRYKVEDLERAWNYEHPLAV